MKEQSNMKETTTKHKTGTRDEWHAAQLDLLKAEKELTRRSGFWIHRRDEYEQRGSQEFHNPRRVA